MEDKTHISSCGCGKNNNGQCEIKTMTLDEAIEHENEIANNEDCECCAANHRQLANWLSELKDIKNKYAYLAADFDNYKKRVVKNEQYVNDKAYEDVIIHFLRTYDDMQRLYDNQKSQYQELTDDISKEHSAYFMIFENLEKTLISLNCEKISCEIGDKFDVNTMEAISTKDIKDNEKYNEDTVVEIYQTGWKFKDKVIRPVKVIVGK